MEQSDLIYKMAFSFLKKRLNVNILREFEDRQITPEQFFTLPTKELIHKLGIPKEPDFDKIAREEAVAHAREELKKISAHNIKPLFVLDDDYPVNLAETDDPPIILYKLGEAELDNPHIISVVGTRKPTPYGIDSCNKLVDEAATYFPDSIIVSGLAYGIDSVAHKKALEKEACTVAVVAHGLNMIYPAANRNLAKDIIRRGGAILSEYPFDVKPFKPNFLARNRIVAGLAQVTVVVESNIKGGAMSTANYAFVYNRDVMAFPGRNCDSLSSGCNLLIKKNKAHLIESMADVLSVTGWQPLNIPIDVTQKNLFPELSREEDQIYQLLKYSKEPVQLDNIVHQTGWPVAKVLSILGELEFEGIITKYPGNRFSI